MESVYSKLIAVALWLGMASFVLALVMLILNQRFLFMLVPGGILRGAQTLFLLAVAAYCARKTTERS